MIQATIERMAQNRFVLKNLTVTLMCAIFVLLSDNILYGEYMPIIFVPILFFWITDAYYLQQERKYRAHYEAVRANPEDAVDFDMNPAADTDSNPDLSFESCFLAKSEVLFYITVAVAMKVIIATVRYAKGWW